MPVPGQVSLQRLLSSPDSARRTLSAAAAAAFPAFARAAGESASAGDQDGGSDEAAMPEGFVPQQSAFSVPASRRGELFANALAVVLACARLLRPRCRISVSVIGSKAAYTSPFSSIRFVHGMRNHST